MSGNAKLRVCLVGLAYPFRGGISHYTTMLYRALAPRHEVLLVTLRRQYPKLLFPGTSQTDPDAVEMKVPDEPIIDSLNPLTWVRASLRIRRFRPDITIFQWWMPFFGPCFGSMSALLRLGGVRRICFLCHNVRPHQNLPLDRLFAWYGLRFADRFVVHSEEDLRNLFAARKGVKASRNPHPTYDFFGRPVFPGAVEARASLGLAAGPVLLFFGFVKPYKGLMDLVEAMPAIREATGATLLVVGEFYEERRKYEQALARLGLSDAVRLVDRYVPNREVPRYFSAADLVVLPYRSATQSGIAQIALGLGKPCVVTRVGGLPEVIRHEVNGFTVPPGDPRAIAEAVIRFFGGPWAETFGENIRKDAARFSWERIVSILEEMARD